MKMHTIPNAESSYQTLWGKWGKGAFVLPRKGERKELLKAFVNQDWQVALAVVNRMAQGDFTYDMLDISIFDRSIATCRSTGNWQVATFFFSWMRRQRVSPDVVCCSNLNQHMPCRTTVACFHCPTGDDVHPRSCAGLGMSWSRHKQLAIGVWDLLCGVVQCAFYTTMPTPRSSNISCNGSISTCAAGSEWKLALNLLRGMSFTETRTDAISFSATIVSTQDRRQGIVVTCILPMELKLSGRGWPCSP